MRLRSNTRGVWPTVLAGTLALGLVVLAPALAKDVRYKGEIEGSEEAKLSFKLDENSGEPRIRSFKGREIESQCSSFTTETYTGTLRFRLKDSGKFGGRKEKQELRSSYVVVVRGELLNGGRAKGTLRVIDEFDFSGTCDTGTVNWTAER